MTQQQAQLMLGYLMLAQPHVRMTGPEFDALGPVFRMIQGIATGSLSVKVEMVDRTHASAVADPSG